MSTTEESRGTDGGGAGRAGGPGDAVDHSEVGERGEADRANLGPVLGHHVVCGSDTTAVRLVEELRAVHEDVTVVVADVRSDHAREIAALGATLVEAARPNVSALREAGVPTARALALLAADDLGNVHAALTAEELNPTIRLVVHVTNPRLGDYLERLVPHSTIVSAAAMAAPAFVAAALDESEVRWVNVAGREVAVGPSDLISQPALADLAVVPGNGPTKLIPAENAENSRPLLTASTNGRPTWPRVESRNRSTRIVLGSGIRRPPRRVHPRVEDFLTDLARIFDHRLRRVGVAMLAFIALGSLALRLWWPRDHSSGIDWLDALYIAVSTVTQTGFDDSRLSEAAPWVRLVGVGVQLLGLVMVSLLTAAIVDAFVGTSLARSLNVLRGRPRGHVVVCGLGTVGTGVAERLHERGFNVVAIERDQDKPGVRAARALRIPVLIGDVSSDAMLYEARLHRCRALVAVTNDDVANLQAGLYARERNAEARIVLRLFDHDLAARVEERLGLGATRSVSMLAAPEFAAKMLERRVEATVPAGRRVLLVTEVSVGAGCQVEGEPVGSLAGEGAVRLLAHRAVGRHWNWTADPATPLRAGDMVAVAASRAGLAEVLLATRSRTVPAPEPNEEGTQPAGSDGVAVAAVDAAGAEPVEVAQGGSPEPLGEGPRPDSPAGPAAPVVSADGDRPDPA
ncbi:NAD-binding protein [Actinopolymorpha pittospori]|uniref:Trk K+ transport system NAD-binding subunit n=1 Tax=Actinopolymorpha pittospori TaxID=648752 RepID=A0A927RDX7_9ACTN|nr:Trk K+ transport system NAD-binding subunit [Actinopolymorpha pittospori]